MFTHRITHTFCLLALLPLVARAESDELWLNCAKITDSPTRLACFDGAANNQLKTKHSNEETAPSVTALTAVETEEQESLTKSEPRKPLSIEEENRALLAAAGVSERVAREYTPLSKLYDLDSNADGGILTMRAHHPNYILPAWYNDKRNRTPSTPKLRSGELYDGDLNNTEVKFQISFKTKLWEDVLGSETDVWFGYTQQSYWQLYNARQSAPFRATDYAPELFVTKPVNYDLPFNGKLRMVGGGVVHQSNGETKPLSRSWNRAYAMAGMEWGKLTVVPRVWWRMPEKSGKDDNPDITDYMGYGDIKVGYQFGRQSLGSTFTYNPARNKGGARLEYVFPVYGNLKGYVQYFEGYGENLQDYNFRSRSIGVGIMLYDWGGI